MRSPTFRFFKQILCSAAAVALLGLVVIAGPARADVSVLCPNAANQNGSGTYTFTPVAGPLDSTCSTDSAVTMSIPDTLDYARLAWDPTDAGYPAGLTLGTLSGATADVAFTGPGTDQPFYMLSFNDPTAGFLGPTTVGDQILMIEFQPSALSGPGDDTLALDPNATLFNFYDNFTGVYLLTGQADAKTLASWLAIYPSLANESLQQVRIGVGLSGGSGLAESVTVNSLDISTPSVPEPTALLLLLILLGATGLGIHLGQLRNRRS